MSKDGLCRPSADRKKGNMTLTVCGLDGPPPRQHFKPPRRSRIFSSVETNYRFRKLIHGSTIANWANFFLHMCPVDVSGRANRFGTIGLAPYGAKDGLGANYILSLEGTRKFLAAYSLYVAAALGLGLRC